MNLIAKIITRVTNATQFSSTVWVANRFNKTWRAVCLGDAILFANDSYLNSKITFDHEYGHHLQYKQYKIAYWIIVAIPSLFGFWKCKIKGDWSDYYHRWPENDADRRGGVKR